MKSYIYLIVLAVGFILFFVYINKQKKKTATNKTEQQPKKQNKSRSKEAIPKMYIPKTNPQVMSMFYKEYDEKSGIMKIDDTHYSVCYEYTDVSFAKANENTQTEIFLKWVDYLNSLNTNMHLQVVHCGIPLATDVYKEDFVYPINDKMSENEKRLAEEFNEAIINNLGSKATTFCEKRLIVITIQADKFETAKDIFYNYQMDIEESFANFKSKIRKWSIEERLQFLYNTFNLVPFILKYPNGERIIDMAKKQGISVYDFIAPKEEISLREQDYILVNPITENDTKKNENNDSAVAEEETLTKTGQKYIKVMYVDKLPTSISPEFYVKLTSIEDADIIVTENITPHDPAKVIKKLEKKISGLKTERLEAIKRAAKAGYNYEYVRNEKLEEKLENQTGLRQALVKKKQKLFTKNTIIVITANDYDEMKLIESKVLSLAGEYLVGVKNLNWQQLEGLQNALPFGVNTLQFQRSLHSEACAESVPFNTKSLVHKNSLYYGTDMVSKSMLCCDRKKLMNGNGCVLATSGAGKSFFVKTNIEQIKLRYPEDEIFIIDPQDEYTKVVEALGGQVIEISTTAHTYINPFDMELQYVDDDNDPIKTKIEYILAFVESIVGGTGLTGEQTSLIDRATKRIYEKYAVSKLPEDKPSFPVFYKELQTYGESEAKNLVLILERYVKGGMDIFSKDTNVEIQNKVVCFDLHNLTPSMQTTGYLVILEHIMNRVSRNKKYNKNSWINIDEFHILLENKYSAEYIAKIYKIGRKFGCLPTIITQNIADVLRSDEGCKILSNTEFAVILKQKPLDLDAICKIFNISNEERKYCSQQAPSGQGLIVYGEDIVPFRNKVSKDSYIYELNNTDGMQVARG